MIKLITLGLILISWSLLAQNDGLDTELGDPASGYVNEAGESQIQEGANSLEPALIEEREQTPPRENTYESEPSPYQEQDSYRDSQPQEREFERESNPDNNPYESNENRGQPEPYSDNQGNGYEERERYEENSYSEDY